MNSRSTPTPPFGLTMLPTELIEQILADVYPYDGPLDKNDLLAVMKTCRLLYALGSVRLYYAPLRVCRYGRFGRLVATLKSRSRLALAVVDLATLSETSTEHQAYLLSDRSGGDVNGEQAWNEALRLQLDILRSCTNVESVSIILSTRPDTSIIASLLAKNSRLRYLVLIFEYAPAIPPVQQLGPSDLRAFKTCLEGMTSSSVSMLELPRLVSLELRACRHSCTTPCDLGPTLRNLSARLVIDTSNEGSTTAHHCCLAGLFGADADSGERLRWPVELEFVDWNLTLDYAAEAYIALPSLLQGNQLTSFTFCEGSSTGPPKLFAYTNPAMPSVQPSDSFFASFPLVRRLCLVNLEQMSLGRLVRLVTSSPFLVTLKLPDSQWNIQPDDLTLVPPSDLSLFEIQIAETLETLELLKEVDLGVWPYAVSRGGSGEDSGRVGLQARLATSGIQLTVHGCPK